MGVTSTFVWGKNSHLEQCYSIKAASASEWGEGLRCVLPRPPSRVWAYTMEGQSGGAPLGQRNYLNFGFAERREALARETGGMTEGSPLG